MDRRLTRLWIGVFASLAMVGCPTGTSETPAAIGYGVDACAECRSIIGEPRFAAQYTRPGGEVKKFDDPGCLFRALRREAAPPTAIAFRDHNAERWLNAPDTWLARTPRTESPRGYGWAAYGSFGEAQDAVTGAGSGEILPFAQAKERAALEPASNPAPQPTPPG